MAPWCLSAQRTRRIDLLEVTDLTRTYGHGAVAHVAIEEVSLSVAEGELVSIVGP